MMKDWSKNSKTHVAHMNSDDFYGNEKSFTLNKDTEFKIELHTDNEEYPFNTEVS